MLIELETVLKSAISGGTSTSDQMAAAIGVIMDGKADPVEIAALLAGLAVRGETAQELAGAAAAMRARATPIQTSAKGVLDTCGTGGDQLHTFNISTAAAIVAAAAGVPVAKHGNRQASSKSGSADVLEALGVDITLSPEAVGQCIDEIGIGFCFARLLHQAMQYVAPVRQKLGIRTIFNLLGPLTNPAGAEYQLLGTNRVATARKLAEAKAQLGGTRTLVVCGADQLDEVSLWGTTTVFDVQRGQIEERHWTVEDMGLPGCRPADLVVGSPAESAAVIREVLAGKEGPARNIVLANTGAALFTAGKASELREAVKLAARAIDSGAAQAKLDALIQFSRNRLSSK
jgi:anthranilate phosphoribosyltransferase